VDNAPLLALPPERLTALPKACPLVMNCTVPPLGVPLELLEASLTVAVNVTPASPYADGLTEETAAVALAAWLTVCPPLKVPLLVVKFPSPLYNAVTL
jgi:hypothetical protein